MVDTTQFTKGSFLNANTAKEGDIVEITHEGEMGEITDPRTKKVKQVLNIPVKIGKDDLIYTPATKSMKALQKIFDSTDSSTWVGKKFKVHIIDMEVAGKELKVVRPKAV